MNAKLKLHQKKIFKESFILEIKLWEIGKTAEYPDGIKYGLIMVNTKTKQKVLMDNHTPKGHHYHLNDKEFEYNYSGIDQLIDDFYSLVKIHLGVTL